MGVKDWNYERHRTRDLLLEYDASIMPLNPRSAGLAMVYPWENLALSNLLKQFYTLAAASGYDGSETDFNLHFGAYLQNKPIIYDIYTNFPPIGSMEKLYFDLEEKILYYWDNQYIPVNAMLIANTTLEGGGA